MRHGLVLHRIRNSADDRLASQRWNGDKGDKGGEDNHFHFWFPVIKPVLWLLNNFRLVSYPVRNCQALTRHLWEQ